MKAVNGIYYQKYYRNNKELTIVYQNINDTISIDECRIQFEKCKQEKILDNDSFDDKKWYGINPINDFKVSFNFELELPQDTIITLKKYILVKLVYFKYAISTVLKCFRGIRIMLTKTESLKIKYIYDFKEFVGHHSQIAFPCRDFLLFTTMENAGEYYNSITGIHENTCIRDIPSYESIFLFDNLICDFLENSDIELRIKFFPVLLWWVITTVIPVRPTEFLILKKNCVYEKDGRYYLHIDRIKEKNKKRKYYSPIMKEFQITKYIYKILMEFIECRISEENNPYLIPYDMYVQNNHDLKKQKMNTVQFSTLLTNFYREIVEGTYKYEIVELGCRKTDNQIERLRPGDTRHLAFMNLMMQGINPLYIQKIGGHYSLKEQLHYCKHIDTFMSAKTYILTRALKDKNQMVYGDMKDWSILNTKRERLGALFYDLPKVQNGAGRCISKNVPTDCICEECLFCNCFIPEKDVSQTYIDEVEKRNAKNIELKKELLQQMLKASIPDEKEITMISSSLSALMNQKLIIDAYILNIKKGEDTG